jgi:hypothetical protein
MKKPPSKTTPPTPERKQGKGKGSGINKPVERAKVPQVKAVNTYGRPTQSQKL